MAIEQHRGTVLKSGQINVVACSCGWKTQHVKKEKALQLLDRHHTLMQPRS